MITETELAKALEEALRYVVTAVVNCDGAHCNEPCCWHCNGEADADFNRRAAVRAYDASTKVLRAWKADQKCRCDAGEFRHRVIPPICPEYFGDDEYCGVCWHNKECHEPKPEQSK